MVLAAGVIGGGLATVLLRNVIHSAVAMMFCFGALAGTYALLGAPIVAAAQVLIYLGAISVLILFAIMLTQAGDANLPAPFQRQAPVAAWSRSRSSFLVGWAVVSTDWPNATVVIPVDLNKPGDGHLHRLRPPVRDRGFLLLAAIIGAIYLARRPEEDERAN